MISKSHDVQLKPRNNVVVSYLVISGVVVLLMIILGIIMLMQQGGMINLSPATFYQLLTMHGTGMVGAVALAASAIMWYFLSHYVKLSEKVLKLNLALFIIGVVMVIIGIFSFEYASSWVFLYPLPAISAGAWGKIGALLYLRSEEHTSELQSRGHLVCRLLLEKQTKGVISRVGGGEGPDAPSRSFIASFDQPYSFQVDIPEGE